MHPPTFLLTLYFSEREKREEREREGVFFLEKDLKNMSQSGFRTRIGGDGSGPEKKVDRRL